MEPTKIVARFLNGGTIKGFTQNFFPDKPSFHITPVDPNVSNGPVEVQIKDLKGIFFVRDFLGNRTYNEQKTLPNGVKITGRKVEVMFKDKEMMVGSVLGYDPKRPGFFLFPSDPHSNNLKIFIVSRAVNKVNYLYL
ncbi:MAG: hypothetical protein ABH969_00690 [Pseudomonadota bacterium]